MKPEPLLGDDPYVRGQMVAKIQVHAVDFDAAKERALSDLQMTADVINFFSDLLFPPSRHAFMMMPGEIADPFVRVTARPSAPGSYAGQSSAFQQPLQAFPLVPFVEGNRRRKHIKAASDLLTADSQRTQVHNRILFAMSWAGRATITVKVEQAFLLYAIALEALASSSSDTTAIGYRLRTRVAHLLGGDIEHRRKVSSEVKKLYGLRSGIVHSGGAVITLEDLGTMRFVTKECILRLLSNAHVLQLKDNEALEMWFEDQMLSTALSE